MTTALLCLLGFAAWTVMLSLSIVSWRTVLVLKKEFQPHTFTSGTPHGPEVYWRLNRAHINAAENLAVFTVVVLAAAVARFEHPQFGNLACIVLGGRIVQTVAHLAANNAVSVSIRVTALIVQLATMIVMGVLVVQSLM